MVTSVLRELLCLFYANIGYASELSFYYYSKLFNLEE